MREWPGVKENDDALLQAPVNPLKTPVTFSEPVRAIAHHVPVVFS